jgi:hypothetical protein
LHNVAIANLRGRSLDHAMDAIEAAIKIHSHALGRAHPRVADSSVELSFWHRKWGWTSCESNLVRMVAATISREILKAFILAAVRCKDGVTGFLAVAEAADLS